MPGNRLLIGLHGAAVLVALAAALGWPRAGQAALMVPLGSASLPAVLAWAEAEDAALLRLDPGAGTIIARIPTNHSLLGAVQRGILPVAARPTGCAPSQIKRSSPWTS